MEFVINYVKGLSDPVTLLGLVASVLVIVSMCFNTKTVNGEKLMRVVNMIASIVSVIYAAFLGPTGFSVLLLNLVLTFVNLYHLVHGKHESDKPVVPTNMNNNDQNK